jgi:hypothetical protein
MILISALPAESIILLSACAESIIPQRVALNKNQIMTAVMTAMALAIVTVTAATMTTTAIVAAATTTAGEKQQSTKSCSGKIGNGSQCSPSLNPSNLMSSRTSIQGGTESMILSACAESITLSALPAESMMLSAPLAESMILLSAQAESIILSAGGAKQQSTKCSSGKCGNNGSGRGHSGGGNGFDIGSGGGDYHQKYKTR